MIVALTENQQISVFFKHRIGRTKKYTSCSIKLGEEVILKTRAVCDKEDRKFFSKAKGRLISLSKAIKRMTDPATAPAPIEPLNKIQRTDIWNAYSTMTGGKWR